MIDQLKNFKLTSIEPWGFEWIDTETDDRLQYVYSQQSFIMNDYFVVANKDTQMYRNYEALLERAKEE